MTHDRHVVSKDGRYPITLIQGVTWRRTFVARDVSGDRISLTGYSGIAQMRDKPDGTLFLTFDVEVDDVLNQADVVAEGDDIAAVTKSGVWDFRLEGSGLDEISMVALSPVSLIRQVSE